MNSSTRAPAERIAPQARPALYWTLADALVLAKRQLAQILRIPDELMAATFQPILLVLFFCYVFGGAIVVPGTSYVNYLMAGILVESVMIGSASTGVGVATDLQRGLIDRFRSLPMAQSAVLTGRTLADLVRNTFIVLVAWTVGLLVGFQPAGTVLACFAAAGLLLLASFVFSRFSAMLGLVLRSPEAVQQAGLLWIFPLMFASSAFVPTSSMPGWLRAFAEHQPASPHQRDPRAAAQSARCRDHVAGARLVCWPAGGLHPARGLGLWPPHDAVRKRNTAAPTR